MSYERANTIRKEDISDSDFVDAIELASDGYHSYFEATVISTASSTNHVTISGLDLLNDRDNPVEDGDRIFISGSTSADGYYIIQSIVNSNTLSTVSNINSSTGGTIAFMHPSGASRIGYDASHQSLISATNVQDAITGLSNSAINIDNHESLNTLVHFLAKTGYGDITYTGNKITYYVVWRDSGKTIKDRDYVLTYNGNKVNNVTVKQYDNVGALQNTLVETYTYSGNRIVSLNSVKS